MLVCSFQNCQGEMTSRAANCSLFHSSRNHATANKWTTARLYFRRQCRPAGFTEPKESLHGLNAQNASEAVVGVPHGDWRGGVVHPDLSGVCIRFGQLIFDPAISAWIEAQKAAAVHFTCPNFAV